MAADKKTFIRNAQKQVQKGQIDRAITTYRAILKIDPNDVKVHNTLGDLYIRKNQKKEGIGEYLWVADFYEKDGFLLRSIAICQKILNLEHDMVNVRLKLADLYSQQRLAAEAKKQYLIVAEYFEKKGKVAEALEAFSKLADLDPGNLQIRIRLGSSYEKQDMPGKAAKEYARAAEGLVKAGNPEKAAELLGKALEISPDNVAARRAKADLHSYREEWHEAVETLAPLAAAEDAEVPLLKTYAGACLKTERVAEAIDSLERAQKAEPSSFPLKTLLGRAYIEGKEFEKARILYTPIIEDFLKEDKLEVAEDLARQLTDADPSSEGGFQQLLSVLERKGDKTEIAAVHAGLVEIFEARGDVEAALASFEKVLEISPDDAAAAEGVARLRGEAAEPSPAGEPAPAVGDDGVDGVDGVEAEIVDIDGDERPEIPEASVEAAVTEDATEAAVAEVELASDEEEILVDEEYVEITLEDDGEEVDFGFDVPPDEVPDEEPAAAAAPVEDDGEVQLGDTDQRERDEPSDSVGEYFPVEDVEVVDLAEDGGDDGLEAIDLSTDEEEELSGLPAPDTPAETASAPQAGETSEAAATVPEEEISEPDGEAQAEESPFESQTDEIFASEQEPSADADIMDGADLFSNEEISALVEEGVLDAGELTAEGSVAEGPLVKEETGDAGGLDLDEESLGKIEVVEETRETGAAVGSENEELEEFLAEADFYMQQGLTDEAEFLYQKLVKLAPDNAEIAERMERVQRSKDSAGERTAEEPLIPQDEISALESDLDRVLGGGEKPPEKGVKLTVADDEGSGDTSEFTDFLSDLKGEFEEEIPESAPAATDKESLSEIFQEFQEGLKEQLGEEDFETHYNLGIAYKEMGLMQEALGEFKLSEKSQARQMDSISMISLCLRETGSVAEAVDKLEEGLAIAQEGSDEQKGFRYDLADTMIQGGREEEAREIFHQLFELYPEYRDVAERIKKSSGKTAPDGDGQKVGGGSSESGHSRVSYL